jgi:competence protein ComEA
MFESLRLESVKNVLYERPPWLPAAAGGAAVALVVAVTALWGLFDSQVAAEDRLPRVTSVAVSAAVTEPEVVVHLSGQVVVPGVYRLRPGDRVIDLIDLAGGPSGAADLDQLNLAATVYDGDRIHVPAVGSTNNVAPAVANSTETQSVDINRADAAGLEALPGIGPSLAAAIVEDRDRFGPFASVDDMDRVSGIGPATIERLRPLARV